MTAFCNVSGLDARPTHKALVRAVLRGRPFVRTKTLRTKRRPRSAAHTGLLIFLLLPFVPMTT